MIYSIEDFKHSEFCEPAIVANGNFNVHLDGNEASFNINTSSILTRLIQEAGRWCERFASDLFVSWRSIEQKLEDGTMQSSSYLFGFRESGVDHADFVLNRYNNAATYSNQHGAEYRAVWRLDVEVAVGREDHNYDITMRLYKTDKHI